MKSFSHPYRRLIHNINTHKFPKNLNFEIPSKSHGFHFRYFHWQKMSIFFLKQTSVLYFFIGKKLFSIEKITRTLSVRGPFLNWISNTEGVGGEECTSGRGEVGGVCGVWEGRQWRDADVEARRTRDSPRAAPREFRHGNGPPNAVLSQRACYLFTMQFYYGYSYGFLRNHLGRKSID